MKKILLILATVGSLIACNDKWLDVNPASPKEEIILKLANDYGIDTVGILRLDCVQDDTENIISFSYVQSNKIKAKQYRKSTKELLYEVEDNEPFKWEVKYNVPYVGEVIDSITRFHVSFFDNNLSIVTYVLDSKKDNWGHNNIYKELCFIKNKVVCKKFVFCDPNSNRVNGVVFINEKKWYNDSWVIYAIEWTKNNNSSITEKEITKCYDKYGELLFNVKSSIPNIPLSMSEGIGVDGLDIARWNIQTEDYLWRKTLNLNIPETAKYELTKSELVNPNTVRAIYNITLYDGTKSTKTVTIDVNSGEYTVN